MAEDRATPNGLQCAVELCNLQRTASLGFTDEQEIQIMKEAGVLPHAGDPPDQAIAEAAGAPAAPALPLPLPPLPLPPMPLPLPPMPLPLPPYLAPVGNPIAPVGNPPYPPFLPIVENLLPPHLVFVVNSIFTGKGEKKFSVDQQYTAIRKWVTKYWQHPKRSATIKLKQLWQTHKDGPFEVKEMRYRDPKKLSVQRYPSALGYCNGSEVAGFPLLVPTELTEHQKIYRRKIKSVRFYKLVVDVFNELEAGAGAAGAAVAVGAKRKAGGTSGEKVAAIQSV